MGDAEVHALKDVDLTIAAGDYLAVVGPSGSGKSTLLNVLGCLDRPTCGRYCFGGREVDGMSEPERSRLRQHDIGFVFQFFHLLARLTAQGNVELPMLFAGVARDRAPAAGRRGARAPWAWRHAPTTGRTSCPAVERQRVAIARAVVMGPALLLADEPTGNLDRASARRGDGAARGDEPRRAQTLVVVTHDPEVAARAASRVLRMERRTGGARRQELDAATREHAVASFGIVLASRPARCAVTGCGRRCRWRGWRSASPRWWR